MYKRQIAFFASLVLVMIVDICGFLDGWGDVEFADLVIIAAIITWLTERHK